jgi:hypothetical protein
LVLAGTLARTGNVIFPGWVMDTTYWPKKMAVSFRILGGFRGSKQEIDRLNLKFLPFIGGFAGRTRVYWLLSLLVQPAKATQGLQTSFGFSGFATKGFNFGGAKSAGTRKIRAI